MSNKIWIYQANRKLTSAEGDFVMAIVDSFVAEWKAHGTKLNAKAEMKEDLFLILSVDESGQEATGCSIDESVGMLRSVKEKTGIDFLDRSLIAFKKEGGDIELLPRNAFLSLIKDPSSNTKQLKLYNNFITQEELLDKEWVQPIEESWAARYLA